MEMQYKDSRVDWIGQIPKNWNTEKFKHIFRIKKILAGKLGYDVLSVTQQGLKIKDITSNEGQVANDYSNYQLVFPGDFVMNHMDLLTGYVDVSKQEGVTSPDYRTFYAINKNNINKQYYLYIFQFCYKTRLFYNLGHGVSNLGRWRLPAEEQKEFMLPFPPLSEQQEIAKYLDSKCGEIDGLIALQEQMIAQLTDYKQSVITEAVTKGLNHNAKLVPSGIDWIGEIPEGWKVFALKWLMELYAGATPKSDNENLWDGDIPWITPADYKTEDIFVSGGRRNISQKGLESCATTILPKGSIIFSKRAPIGLVAINSEPLCTNQGCIGCIVNQSRALNKYYYYTLSIFKEQFELYGSGTTFKEISATKFADFIVPVPPLLEQQEIVRYLDDKCSEIDKLIDVKQQKIEKLKDYKKGVIYEAVTGKINIE